MNPLDGKGLTEFLPVVEFSFSDFVTSSSFFLTTCLSPTAPLLPLSNFFSLSRKPTIAAIVAVLVAPPVPCVTAASCQCWLTASMSPSVICVAKPATLMVWRSASPAPAGSTVWRTLEPHREPVIEQERAAVWATQLHVLVRIVSDPVLVLFQNVLGWGVFEAQTIPAGVGWRWW